VRAGGYCFLAAAFLAMLSRATIDRRTIWREIAPEAEVEEGEEAISCTTCDLVQPLDHDGKDCPRCGARLRVRKPYSMVRATALTIAAFIFFFPANILPMNTSMQMGRPVTYTIFKGVRELFANGLWPLGCIIFCTSIVIPAIKILGMGWLIISVRRRSRKRLVLRTKFHRFINEIGRWSNVDPFAITVFVPLMTFATLASSDAAWGSTAFIAVVVLTLLATMCFDSRLMWDAAGEGQT
jgi:paraquat-inducible protein A